MLRLALPKFKNYEIIIGDPFFVFKHNKKRITFVTPIYVGLMKLELSKFHLFEVPSEILQFGYDQNNLNLLNMDADCFVFSCIGKTG